MITLRRQKVEDAQRFYEILNNPNFTYFSIAVDSVADEKKFLLKNEEKTKQNKEHNFTILFENNIVGGCGIKIRQHRPHIGEIGYFIDEAYWGKGIATAAVKELEKIGFEELGLYRIEVWMNPENVPSEKVAIKNNYQKEGLMKKSHYSKKRQCYEDNWLYAKTKEDYLK